MKTLLLSAVLFSAPLFGQESATIEPYQRIPQISTSAHGDVKVTPDRATIQIGVQTRATTAAAAATENASKQQTVLAALRALGFTSEQLSTTEYNVTPEYQYAQNKAPQVIGYTVTNTIVADVRNLAQVGPAIDAALARGANLISSLVFYSSNTDAARRSAIETAVAKARSEAEAAARAAHGSIGSLLELTVSGDYQQPPFPRPMMRVDMAAQAAPGTEVNPGQQNISVNVSTQWRFVPGT